MGANGVRTKIVSVTPGLVHLHVIPFHKKCPSHESLAAGAADHNRKKSNFKFRFGWFEKMCLEISTDSFFLSD